MGRNETRAANWTIDDRALVEAASRMADEVLGPGRAEVDRVGVIPATHFEAMAEAGLFSAAVGTGRGVFDAVAEHLARGCLSTAFVWMQHHGLARRLSSPAASAVHRDVAADLLAGRRRAGVVQAGLLPGDPMLVAVGSGSGSGSGSEEQGWTLHGVSPWCTGWGMVSELLVATRLESDPATVAWFMVPAVEVAELRATNLELQAVDATATVRLRFSGLTVPPAGFLGFDAYAEVGHPAGRGLRPNGSLALGLAARCAQTMTDVGGPAVITAANALGERIDRTRDRLDAANDEELPAARADAGGLAIDAARLLVTAQGAAAAIRGSAGEQAMREAAFLLVFGSRPSIKDALLLQR